MPVEDLSKPLIRYGREFWRRALTAPDRRSAEGAWQKDLNISDVVERISHAWQRETDAGSGSVEAVGYSVSLSSDGVRFAPRVPASATFERSGEEGRAIARDVAVHLRTASVRLGASQLYGKGSERGAWNVVGNTAQAVLDREFGVIEHCETRGAGVELTWILSRRPKGVEPFAIELEMDALAYAGQTKMGHHFADANGIARLRVGEAEAVDSFGRKLVLRPTISEGRMIWEVPGAWMAAAQFPVALDPFVTPEFGLDLAVTAESGELQGHPDVATSGGVGLVVWADRRSGNDWNIYGARIDINGVVLDTEGIAISRAESSQENPVVAGRAGDFLVVWEDGRRKGLSGARVSASGELLDRDGIEITGDLSTRTATHPAVASDGTSWLIAWDETRADPNWHEIYATRVAGDGAVLDPGGTLIRAPVRERDDSGQLALTRVVRWPAVASGGGTDLIVWSEDTVDFKNDTRSSVVRGVLWKGAIEWAAGQPVLVATQDSMPIEPAVAANGSDYLVAWSLAGELDLDIFGCLVSATNGTRGDPFPICVEPGDQLKPDLAGLGDGFVAAWTEYRLDEQASALFATLVSRQSRADTNRFILALADALNPAPRLAHLADGVLATWRGSSPSGIREIRLTQDENGSLSFAQAAPALVSAAGGRQGEPVVASNGSEILIVWPERRAPSSASDIAGTILSRDGIIQFPDGFGICVAPGDQDRPAVASDGDDFMVAWEDDRHAAVSGRDVFAARVSASGHVAGEGFAVSTAPGAQLRPALAGHRAGYLIAWEDGRNVLTSDWDIYGSRVSLSGTVRDSDGLRICIALDEQRRPRVAAGASRFLVVWRDSRNRSDLGSDVYAAAVTTDGNIEPSGGGAVGAGAGGNSEADVASNGSEFLVAWRANEAGAIGVIARRLNSSGVPLDSGPLRVTGLVDNPGALAVAGDGAGFMVVWQDECGRAETGSDLRAARITRGGQLQDGAAFNIAAAAVEETAPAAASSSWAVPLVYRSGEESSAEWRARLYFPAAIRFVTVSPDLGEGDYRTIQEALDAALPGQTILVGAGTYHELIRIEKDVTLEGAGTALTILDGCRAGPVVLVTNRVTAFLEKMMIRNGYNAAFGEDTTSGGGVVNFGTLTVRQCAFTNNTAASLTSRPNGGGAIDNAGTLTVENSVFMGNRADNGGGAGEESYGGAVLNRAGAARGNAWLRSCTFIGNSASEGGGAVYSEGDARAGEITIINCTLSGNRVTGEFGQGGAILNVGSMRLVSSTVVSNRISGAQGDGGGVYTRPGSFNFGYEPRFRARNSIIAGNQLTDPGLLSRGADLSGGLESDGFNLIQSTNGIEFANRMATDLLNAAPMLGPLTNQAQGPVLGAVREPQPWFHFPARSSPAVDAGSAAGAEVDQAGLGRPILLGNPREGSDGADIGAVELRGVVYAGPSLPSGEQSFADLQTAIDHALPGSIVIITSTLFGEGPLRGSVVIDKDLYLFGLAGILEGSGDRPVVEIRPGCRVIIEGIELRGGAGGDLGGGGIRNYGSVHLVTCRIRDNTGSVGGGVLNAEDAELVMEHSEIRDNAAQAGGGGLMNRGTARFQRCTIAGNQSATNGGGGIFNDLSGRLVFSASTLSGNSSGGIFNLGRTELLNATVTANAGAGVASPALDCLRYLSVSSSIIAGNGDSGQGPDGAGRLVSHGHNLIGNGDGSELRPGPGDQIGDGQERINPQLGPLQPQGRTRVHIPLFGSPAIDRGNAGPLRMDQAGVERPAKPGAWDAGAVEFQPLARRATLSQAGNDLVWTWTATVHVPGPWRFQWRRNGDNIPGATNLQLTVRVTPEESGRYHLLAASPVGLFESKPFYLEGGEKESAADLEDEFARARMRVVPAPFASMGQASGCNFAATAERIRNEPFHAGYLPHKSVWLSWRAPQNGTAVFDTIGSSFDTLLAVYTGDVLADLAAVASDDDAGGSFTSRVSFKVRSGEMYRIAVDGFFGVAGRILLQWKMEPEKPQIIEEPSSQVVALGASVRFQVRTDRTDARYQWFYNGEPLPNAQMAILELSSVRSFHAGAYRVEAMLPGGGSVFSELAHLQVIPAGVGSLAMDKFEDLLRMGGSAGLRLTPAAALHSAPFRAGLVGSQWVHSYGASWQESEPNQNVIAYGSRWLSFTAEEDLPILIDTVGSDVRAIVNVYTGTNLTTLTTMASDAGGAPDGRNALVWLAAEKDTTYYVSMASLDNQPGLMRLNWNASGRSQPASFRWVHFQPDTSGIAELSATNSVRRILAVYTGEDLVTLYPVAGRSLGTGLQFAVQAGRNYLVAIDAAGPAGPGDLQIQWHEVEWAAVDFRIERKADGSVSIAWRGGDFLLESAQSPAGPWTVASGGGSRSISGDRTWVVIPSGETRQFYRLRLPPLEASAVMSMPSLNFLQKFGFGQMK